MNGNRILAAEFGVSMAIVTWGAVNKKYWPYPINVNRTVFAYAIIGLFALINENLAALLAAGFILAQVVKTPLDSEGNFKFTGGIPELTLFDPLTLGVPVGKDKGSTSTDKGWAPSSPGMKPAVDTSKPQGGPVNI